LHGSILDESAVSLPSQRFTILRGVLNDIDTKHPLPEKPLQVWTIIDEALLEKAGLFHLVSAFLEDQWHDWSWSDGALRFYSHSGRRGDVHDLVIVSKPAVAAQIADLP
jgi:hypothetical protein